LAVDHFGVQYVGEEHDQHLSDALEQSSTISKDLSGGLYYGITLEWDYKNKHVLVGCVKSREGTPSIDSRTHCVLECIVI
jgi:hypothetical protein